MTTGAVPINIDIRHHMQGVWRRVTLSPHNIVPPSALVVAKAALYEAMREAAVGRAELARRLRWHLPQVTRVLELRHASKMEQVEAPLAALGLRLIVDVARAA